MKKIVRAIFLTLSGLFVVFVSLLSLSSSKAIDSKLNLATLVATPANSNVKETLAGINDLPFDDNLVLYQKDDSGSVVVIYVTVRIGNEKDNTNHTWGGLNDSTQWVFGSPPENGLISKAEAIVQFGDENGPIPGELGYGTVAPNATIQVRALPTKVTPQESYKIELRKNAGTWRGQSSINLNKHDTDLSRVRQKLNFDLMKQIPNMVSLRTQFVHLYVKDETDDPVQTTFKDYGLFTQVEQPNKKFLANHLLDRDGQLYKAAFFEFYRYPDQIRMSSDPLYDATAFSRALEIKGNSDHTKLIKMLNDVNDYNIPIEQTFNKYFNADNYFTWLAYSILVGNVGTENTNFFLYSPKNGDKWYFIPWDYDGAFPLRSWDNPAGFQYEDWQSGVSNYWGSALPNRVLRVESYRQMLDQKINELMLFLTPTRITDLLNEYKPVTDKYVSRMPDVYYLPASLDDYNQAYKLLPNDIQENYQLYLQSLEKPMPFHLGTPQISGDMLTFNWDEAYDFNSKNTTYHMEVSTDWTFANLVYEETLTNLTSTTTGPLTPGVYFWQVTATNESGKSQLSYDRYFDADGVVHQGMKYFTITPNGQVLEQ